MIPDKLANFEAAIISTCSEHERMHCRDPDYRCCVDTQGFFVKFDSFKSLYPQVETQKYVFDCAELDKSAPRVPKVLHFFPPKLSDGVCGHGVHRAYRHSGPGLPPKGGTGSPVAS